MSKSQKTEKSKDSASKAARRGTPRKGPSSPREGYTRVSGDSEATGASLRNGPLSPKFIFIFLLVALVSVGGFALWKTMSKPAEEPVVEQKPTPTIALETDDETRVQRLMNDLTLEQKVAQLFVVQPEAITDVDVAIAAGDATREALTKYPVGGICYFASNLQTPKQVKEMLRASQNYTKDVCGLPLFTCVDEEGGTVARVASNEAFEVTDVGDMADIGAEEDVEKARDAANVIGGYLAELGFNVDFAPVADIVESQDNVMYERSFGATPELVSSMVVAQIDGFTRAGVLCAAKHFPGIGNAEGDSHNENIYSSDTIDDMLSWSCVPFKAAIDAHVPMIMVSHLSCQGLGEGKSNLPASLNPDIIEGLLRETLGYGGVIITDSLQMEAATNVSEPDEQAVMAIEAGADLVLMPKDFKQAYKGLLGAVESGRISEERIDESVRRIIATKLEIGA